MSNRTLTHKDLAAMTGVSVTTIKSYRRKFGEFIPVARFSKPIRFQEEAGPVCVKIRSLFADGLSIKAVYERLSAEFKKYSLNDNLSIASSSSPGSDSDPAQDSSEITRLLKDMLKGLSASVTSQASMGIRLASIENSLKQLIELEALREEQLERLEQRCASLAESGKTQTPSKTNLKRVVTVKSENGRSESYVLGAEEKKSHNSKSEDGTSDSGTTSTKSENNLSYSGTAAHGDNRMESDVHPSQNNRPYAAKRPTRDFMALPVAMHSKGGDYLGITGPKGRPFNLAEFERHLLTRSSGPDFPSSTWRGNGDTWTCTISGNDASSANTMTFIRTRTPRGNVVAHLSSMDVNGKRAGDAFLQAFFREIKTALGG